MTAEEQAQIIFEKMKGFRVKHRHAKKCAKVAVEYLIYHADGAATKEHWRSVLAAIDKIETP